MISSPLYLEGVTAYAKAAQTPSHSRILNLEQIWLKVEILLEHPISPELISTSIPSAGVFPQIGGPLLQKSAQSLANLTVNKGLRLVQHKCKP